MLVRVCFFRLFFTLVVAIEIELLSSEINQTLRPLTSNPRLLCPLRVQYIRLSQSVKSKGNIESNPTAADAGNERRGWNLARAAGGFSANRRD